MIDLANEMGLSEEEIIEEGIYFRNKIKTQGPLKVFLATWDGMMFDLHRQIIQDGGLGKYFPGVKYHAISL